MSKTCTICKLPEGIQNRIRTLRAGENKQSYKDIEATIDSEFNIKVDASSLSRHFKNHIKKGSGAADRGLVAGKGKGMVAGKGGRVNYPEDLEKDVGVGKDIGGRKGTDADHESSDIGLADSDIALVGIEDKPPTNTEIHKELCNVLSNSIRIFSKRMNETASSAIPYDTHIDAIKALDILVNTFEKLYQNPREGTKQQEPPALGALQIKIAHEILREPIEEDSLKTKLQNIFEAHQKQKNDLEECLKEQ